ncbi:helix-turn-helix domain-containing protein [Sediminibacterium ginsengisoli]|uniref:DNA-binding transcriptional regulator, XRE-family HTH domain n=1 Tax=Sediminibacterium ginsengisoli TaxID=413434 RepID=A0A1T4NF08_9BACT|nr:DNA-binding transcriptional regulator, XRE-family HTH domain [Sediminibacterium ginsengisoli]
MDEVSILVPNRLRRLRKQFGYTKRDVAEFLGLKNSSDIAKWEEGVKLPRGGNLLKLCALYRTSSNELYYDLINEYKKQITLKEYKRFDT